MTITSELIGKLGGSEVNQIPVSVTASGGSGSKHIFHTVEVPEGETWLIVLHGDLQSDRGGSISSAHLLIGDTTLDGYSVNGINSLAHVGTGTINVELRRNRSNNSDSFTGTLYTVKM